LIQGTESLHAIDHPSNAPINLERSAAASSICYKMTQIFTNV